MNPETLSLSGFAEKHGWHKSQSSHLKKKGHLVLDANGRVLVAASEALLASLKDPSKAGVVERHQVNRSQGVLNQAFSPAADGGEGEDTANPNSSARRAAALADIVELDRDQRYKKVCDVDVVQSVLLENYVSIRQLAERIPFEMRPFIAPEHFELLSTKIRVMLKRVSDTASTFAEKIRNTEQ